LKIPLLTYVDKTIVVHQNLTNSIDTQSSEVTHAVNERGNSPCGRWNHAIDLLIMNRFAWGINIEEIEVILEGWNAPIKLLQVLEAGGYDEALDSFFHEDLLIRLENSGYEDAFLDSSLELMLKNAHGDPTRFAMKHQYRLNESEWEQISNCIEVNHTTAPLENVMGRTSIVATQREKQFTIGVTLGNLILAKRFLFSFYQMMTNSTWPTKLVICLHRILPADIEKMIQEIGLNNIELVIHSEEWGHERGINGGLGPWFHEEWARSGVSWGRCVLHHALWLATRLEKKPLIWILDDDIILEKEHLHQIAQSVIQMESKGCVVGIGHILGDPPIMPIFTMRTQLIDRRYALLAKSCPHRNRMKLHFTPFHDMHHDLSTERMDHLEFPVGIKNALNTDFDITALISGKCVTRQIHSEWMNRTRIPVRGGNTLLLSSSPLSRWPNVAPTCSGIHFRRGDTLWAQWNELEEPDSICSILLSVNQNRLINGCISNSVASIRGDIAGSMLTRAVRGMDSMSQLCTLNIQKSVLTNSRLREARLITNLIRIASLMRQIGTELIHIQQIDKLASKLLQQDWPVSMREELGLFLSEFITSTKVFNRAHRTERGY